MSDEDYEIDIENELLKIRQELNGLDNIDNDQYEEKEEEEVFKIERPKKEVKLQGKTKIPGITKSGKPDRRKGLRSEKQLEALKRMRLARIQKNIDSKKLKEIEKMKKEEAEKEIERKRLKRIYKAKYKQKYLSSSNSKSESSSSSYKKKKKGKAKEKKPKKTKKISSSGSSSPIFKIETKEPKKQKPIIIDSVETDKPLDVPDWMR